MQTSCLSLLFSEVANEHDNLIGLCQSCHLRLEYQSSNLKDKGSGSKVRLPKAISTYSDLRSIPM